MHTHGLSVEGGASSNEKVLSQASAAPELPVSDTDVQDTRSAKAANGIRHSQILDSANMGTPIIEQIPVTLDSSNIVGGTPAAPSNGGITAMDLVRQMQRSSVGSTTSQRSFESPKVFVQPSLPSVYNTAFTPTLSEKAQLSPRLDTVQKRSPTFNVPEVNSSAVFHDHIARQQRDVQMRVSPQPGFQTPASWDTTYGQTPTGLDSMFRAFEKQQGRTPSPFASPHVQANGRSPQPRSSAMQQAPFGVIGQARPPSSGTPTSGQG